MRREIAERRETAAPRLNVDGRGDIGRLEERFCSQRAWRAFTAGEDLGFGAILTGLLLSVRRRRRARPTIRNAGSSTSLGAAGALSGTHM
eukprot:scaffold102009_cov60-Phaeocystis_antarctica.AAC.2